MNARRYPRTMNGVDAAWKDATYACAISGPRPRVSLLARVLQLLRIHS